MSFTAAVRDELAHSALGRACCRRVETGVLLRLAGSYRRVGGSGGVGAVLQSPSAAVVRRARATLLALGAGPEVHVIRGHRGTPGLRYRLVLDPPAEDVLSALGLLTGDLRPPEGVLAELPRKACDAAAAVRGALLGTGSVSSPGSRPHLELGAPGPQCAEDLAGLLRRCGAESARSGEHHGEWRVVVKSAEAIGVLLARAGAHGAYLRWDQERLHRELRREATRGANADRANLARTVAAASQQVAAVEDALTRLEWAELAADLREIALARLANPEASLAELGALVDPPVAKSTAHRRLARLTELAGRTRAAR